MATPEARRFEVVLSRRCRAVVSRHHRDAGQVVFVFEVDHGQQRIEVQESFLDSLRRTAVVFLRSLMRPPGATVQAETLYCSFGGQNIFRFDLEPSEDGEVVILTDLQGTPTSNSLVIPADDTPAFVRVLFDDRLAYPSGCLDRVMNYHALLQLAFPHVSGSLNAMMGHRTGFLTFEIASPQLNEPLFAQAEEVVEDGASAEGKGGGGGRRAKPKSFQSRLGLRTRNPTSINYDELLMNLGVRLKSETTQDESQQSESRRKEQLPGSILDLGLTAASVRGSEGTAVRLKSEAQDLEDLRQAIAANQGSDVFFVGFDVVDLWFLDRNRRVRALRFPLYFTDAAFVDMGSDIEVRWSPHAKVHLNILALCDVVVRFSGSKASDSVLEEVLSRIQRIRLDWQGQVERVRVERSLPVAEGILVAQRRAILGQEERGPIGGVLDGLRVEHVTIDSERTLVFPRNLAMSEAELSRAKDLLQIRKESEQSTRHFNRSLLGSVFNPLRPSDPEVPESRVSKPNVTDLHKARQGLPRCHPYELPDALKFLFDEFDRKDLLLVEGPPGTGKTFSMLNLLVHCVCTGKRVLIVSDKVSALDALHEKLFDFMKGGATDEREMSQRELALRVGIKKPIWSTKGLSSVQESARVLRTELRLELLQEALVSTRVPTDVDLAQATRQLSADLTEVDKSIQTQLGHIDRLLARQFSDSVAPESKVCGRSWHETTAEEIRDLAEFSGYLISSPDVPFAQLQTLLRAFVRNRQEILAKSYPDVAAELCPADYRSWRPHAERLVTAEKVLQTILKERPLTMAELMAHAQPLVGTRWPHFLAALHARAFASSVRSDEQPSGLRRLRDKLFFPLAEDIQNLLAVVADDLKLSQLEGLVKRRCVNQLARIHSMLIRAHGVAEPCLAWAILHQLIYGSFATDLAGAEQKGSKEVGFFLDEVSRLQERRTKLVRQFFTLSLLSSFSQAALARAKDSGAQGADPRDVSRDLVAAIDSQLERVVKSENALMASQSFGSLKEIVASSFPVWLLLKDQVSLALPLAKGLFDVVIIDESTQCKVDDAIPLIYRASKVIAVGDENQTVLQRSSVLDDFLFENFELENHLHAIGAASVKAAGSHFFGLLKGLKQSRILLDEHFRCPPEVIQYSNQYVYDGLLKVMKWRPQGSPEPVVVDYSERRTRNRNRPTSGKFKGIEIGMIDRFFDWVEQSILDFEKETGRRINLETDVAICYFLLKNEEYVKQRKSEFLRSMKRGEDVLDGAGAALQGKERDLIFFLWDITRANFQAFMQGDDPAKRKGELNVLMSRPKLRSYHYLHKDFASLDHNRSSITHYLWSIYNASQNESRRRRQEGSSDDTEGPGGSGPWQPHWLVRQTRPSPSHVPWRRSDGQLLWELLRVVCARTGLAAELAKYRPQFGVIIGRADHRVDLVLNPIQGHKGRRLAFVELSGFESSGHAHDLQSYASVLRRAQPAVVPVFLHSHELFDAKGFVLTRIKELLRSAGGRS